MLSYLMGPSERLYTIEKTDLKSHFRVSVEATVRAEGRLVFTWFLSCAQGLVYLERLATWYKINSENRFKNEFGGR